MNEEERYELEIAAWLHDCGKLITPDYVVDKSTKLQTVYDRIEAVATRIEVLKRDAKIALLEQQLAAQLSGDHTKMDELQQAYQETIRRLDADLDFLRQRNLGSETMSAKDKQEIQRIAQRSWQSGEDTQPLLSNDEIYNLSVEKGTLTPEERTIINNHIDATIRMLEALPFPKHLKNVPEFAGGHHEKMDGSGYPRGLKREEMSVQARIMAIADIFEALTAKDRPYKEGKKLSETLRILGQLKEQQHIDPDLFELFVRERIFEKYAREYLDSSQIDDVDLALVPGL